MSLTVEDEQDVAVQYRPHHSKGRQKGPHVVKLVLTPQFFVLSRNICQWRNCYNCLNIKYQVDKEFTQLLELNQTW